MTKTTVVISIDPNQPNPRLFVIKGEPGEFHATVIDENGIVFTEADEGSKTHVVPLNECGEKVSYA